MTTAGSGGLKMGSFCGRRRHRPPFIGTRSIKVQRAHAILVQGIGDLFAVVTQIPTAHVPFRVRQQVGVLAAGEIDVGKSLEFGLAVGRDENAFAVLRKQRRANRRLSRRLPPGAA